MLVWVRVYASQDDTHQGYRFIPHVLADKQKKFQHTTHPMTLCDAPSDDGKPPQKFLGMKHLHAPSPRENAVF